MNIFNKLGKRKDGSAYWFMYIMLFLFGLGIMYVIFNEILQIYLYPTTQFLTSDTSKADRFLGFWQLTPFILIFLALLFLFLKSTSEEAQVQ